MLKELDENGSAEYYLTRSESLDLDINGFVMIDDICIVKDALGEYDFFKESDDYTSIQLYSRYADEAEEEKRI